MNDPLATAAPPVATPATVTPPPPAEDHQEEGEGASIDTFCEYQPSALPSCVVSACNSNGNDTDNDTDNVLTVPSHTSLACESALLSSVTAPLAHPDAAVCIRDLLKERKLSPLQAEGVLLAIQRHQRIYANGERAGFFLGDGAGVGKGRQIAALLRDSLSRQDTTKRHLWLSVSRELIQDARRDLNDVGVHCEVYDGTSLLSNKGAGLGKANKGVMFLTYPLLVSKNRLEQLVEWCADTSMTKNTARKTILEQSFTGCIIYDEAHKAKNLANDTKTAKLVLELQRRLPKARVLYCSATGVSDVPHLAYAERLGLWSGASHFPNFSAFRSSLESKGLASLELLALELKQQGSFLARTLSWEGAEFENTQIDLTQPQQQTYDRAVAWWTRLKIELGQTIEKLGSNDKTGMIWRHFWSAHQRFFKELAICAKVPFIAKDALKQVQQHNRCVVIGLQSTGDAAMQSLLEAKYKGDQLRLEEERFPALLSTCSAILTNFVQNHFPVKHSPPEIPKLPDPPSASASVEENYAYAQLRAEVIRLQSLPPPEPIPELVEIRQALLETIPSLDLPPNPLDHLIDQLGGPQHVAEMTGRSRRMERPSGKGYFVYAKRVPTETSNNSQDESDRINLVERRHFMDGTKSFAIISDAASTGISLHAARGSKGSHKRRVHYTIELPWSADKAVQQLGRSHRSGQESAPLYKLVVTSLGGERRFAAAVSKRMASLGALTKGDRRAATGSDMLADFDLDSKYGKRALKRFYFALHNNGIHLASEQASQPTLPTFCLPSRNSKEILDDFAKEMKLEANGDPMLVTFPEASGPRQSIILDLATHELDQVGLERDKVDVRVFLNRLAGLTVSRQKLVFSLFMSTLEDVIKEAKATGEFEGTAEDISATTVEIGSEEDLAVDPSCGAPTKLTTLVLDRGISFEVASTMALEEATKEIGMSKQALEPNGDGTGEMVEVKNEMDNFIVVDDSDEEDDEWMSKATHNKEKIAKSGFYISRNKIVGRHFILFAKSKFDCSSFKTEEAAASFDPQGMMIITRPNTGTNMTDMPSRDLERKYRLAFPCEKLKELLEAANVTTDNPAELVEKGSSEVADMWKAAYCESDNYKHQEGLAPRRARVALVTGPVLHVMPALEKSVLMRSERERALKIMRAQVGSKMIVGVRFPCDYEAIHNLKEHLKILLEARNSAGNIFVDEALSPLCNKSMEWATTERKTMKSFFKVAVKPSSTAAGGDTKNVINMVTPANEKATKALSSKRVTPGASSGSSTKKARKLTSFFTKK